MITKESELLRNFENTVITLSFLEKYIDNPKTRERLVEVFEIIDKLKLYRQSEKNIFKRILYILAIFNLRKALRLEFKNAKNKI